jgi:hypothetical protein
MAGAQDEVDAGDTAAGAGAVLAATPLHTSDSQDSHWEGRGCRSVVDPLGVALQDRDRCAGHRVLEGVDHSH